MNDKIEVQFLLINSPCYFWGVQNYIQSSHTTALSNGIAILIQPLLKQVLQRTKILNLMLTILLGNAFKSLKKKKKSNNAGQTPEVQKLYLVELKNLLDTVVLFSSLGDLKKDG